jgi:hypothetical protein
MRKSIKINYEKSVENRFPHLVVQWHPTKNNGLTPADVTCGMRKKVWWICDEGHEWLDSISHRKDGRGCRACYLELLRTGYYNGTGLKRR